MTIAKQAGKISLIVTVLVLANLLFANFAIGQLGGPNATIGPAPSTATATSGTVTKSDIENIDNLVKTYRDLLVQKNNKNDSAVVQARQQAQAACGQLSSKIYPATPNISGKSGVGSYIAIWIPGPPEGCVFGRVYKVNTDGTVDWRYDDTAIGLWNEIKGGKDVSTAPFLERAKAVAGVSGPAEGVNPLSQVVNWILTTVANVITSVLLGLAALAGYILSVVTDEVTAATQPDMVLIGWTFVRDFMNMFFIVALIAMALATILQIENYNWKHILRNLIIMALLINFSKIIAETLISFSDMITQIFISASGLKNLGVTIGNMFSGLVTEGNGVAGFFVSGSGGASEALTHSILKIIAALTITVSFLALAGLLFIRLIGLWVLIILSPVAYALYILPDTQQYAKQWWQTFIKYLIWSPVAMFFVSMANLFIKEKGTGSITNNTNFDALFIAAFFWAAVLVAKQAGMVGSEMVINGAKAVGFGAPKWLGKRGLGWAGRHYNELTSKIRGDEEKVSTGRALAYAIANPVGFFKGWAKEAEEQKHIQQAKAEAIGQEITEQRFSGFIPKTLFGEGKNKIIPRVQQHEKKEEDESGKFLGNLSRENVARKMHQAFTLGNSDEDRATKRGYLKVGMSKGYVDDAIGLAHTNEEGRKMMAEMIRIGELEKDDFLIDEDGDYIDSVETRNKVTEEDRRLDASSHRTRRAFHLAMFGGELHKGFVDENGKFYTGERKSANHDEAETYELKDHAAARMITEEGETEGKNVDHWEYMTDQKFNSKTGKYESYILRKKKDTLGGRYWSSDGEAEMAAAELAKKNSRTQAQIAWHSVMSANGKNFYADVFAKVAKAMAENPTFAQERTANMLIAGTTDENVLMKIRETFHKTGRLEVDKISADRLEKIKNVDPKAFAAIFQRFMNDAQPGSKIEDRINKGLKVRVVKQNRATGAMDVVEDRDIKLQTKTKSADAAGDSSGDSGGGRRAVQPPSASYENTSGERKQVSNRRTPPAPPPPPTPSP